MGVDDTSADAAGRGRSHWNSAAVLLVVLLAGIPAAFYVLTVPFVQGGDGGRAPGPRADLKNLVTFVIARRTGKTSGAWPAYEGKNFVLSVVASKDIDLRRRENLEVLFPVSGLPAGFGPEDYEVVTKQSLETQRFPHLTEVAGRRNMDPAWRITEEGEQEGTPLMAVVMPGAGVLIGFSGGDVRLYEPEELGLRPGEPVRFGDEAKSDLLRCLSDQ